MISKEVDFRVHNSDLQTLVRGVKERVYYVKDNDGFKEVTRPQRGFVNQRLAAFKHRLLRLIPSTNRMTDEEFINTCPARKKELYRKAVATLQDREVDFKDARLKIFVKAEKINFSAKPDPAPRVIQPRNPRYNVECGKYLRPLEKPIYKAVGRLFGKTTICKGLNALQRGELLREKWELFNNPVAIGLDASRFDQHVSPAILEWEHSIYLHCYNNDPLLAKLLHWQIKNKGVGHCSDGMIKYSVDGCRMSGDMNTALGNCLIMCAMVHTLCSEVGVKFQLVNDGDDCVLMIESRDQHKLTNAVVAQFFLELGFDMKIEAPVKVFEQIVFCQAQPVFDGKRYVMVRDPRIAITKDSCHITPVDSFKNFDSMLWSIGSGGVSLCSGIPVLQEFYEMHRRSSVRKIGSKSHVLLESGFFQLSKGLEDRKYKQVNEESRFSFYLAFGIEPDQQRNIEMYYRLHTLSYNFVDTLEYLPPWY